MNLLQKRCFTIALIFLLLFSKSSSAVNYYWVGGSGNWSDINHWAVSSGSTTLRSIVPSVNDHVIFDAASGFTASNKTVTINTNAFCDSMTWSGIATPPTLTINNPLEIRGSLQLQPGMTFAGPSSASNTINFTSSRSGESILTGNISLGSTAMTFNGTGGWILADSLKMSTSSGLVTFTNGTLNCNGQYVNIAGLSSSGGIATRSLIIANSLLLIGNNGWTYTGGIALSSAASANSLIIFNLSSTFTAKAGDIYNNLQMQQGGISRGIYNKVTYTGGISSTVTPITLIKTDTLILAAGKIFYFGSSTSDTINKYFQASSPNCSTPIEFSGSAVGTQSTLVMSAGAVVNVANARIRDIKITGSTPYSAVSSTDVGNNTGWTFSVPVAHNWYWVGASGNWNDVNHWADVSGGLAASGCVPTQYDNVFFDGGSGFVAGNKTVTVDGPAYCDSMTWSGSTTSPTFTISNPVELHGSLWFQPGMTVNGAFGNNKITFASSRLNESITTGDAILSNNSMVFNGTGGWNLLDSLKQGFLSTSISFVNGALNFNGQYVSTLQFSSSSGNATRSLNIANCFIEIGASGWNYTGGIPLAASASINSLISYNANSSFFAKAGDVYYNLLMAQGGISNGRYNKITYTGGIQSATTPIGPLATDTLILAASKVYYFRNSTGADTVHKYFQASSPDCSSLIELYAATSSPQAILSMDPATVVDVANARIRDLRITGSTPYPATKSIDLGNNTGWTFTAPAAHTWYWIGAAGNWNDPAHWANASGGSIGSGCVPTQYDNVIFDGGSGFTAVSKTVTLDVSAYCDSMTWSGIAVLPTLTINNPLEIHGSLSFLSGMTLSGPLSASNVIIFASARSMESVTMGNIAMTSTNITFNGTGGWLLMDSLKQSTGSGILTFTNGTLNTNGQYVRNSSFNSISGIATRSLVIANSTVQTGTWTYTGGVVLTAAASLNSQILSGSNFTAKALDTYNVVQLAAGTIAQGVYKKIYLTGSTTINSINTDTLLFTPNFTYSFATAGTVYINKAWYASGNPCFLNNIQSATAGTRANVSMPASAANYPPNTYGIDFVRLKDMNAVTGADRATLQIGNQSIDNGNNNNWVIVPYAGSAGITGLGPDSLLYCNSFPDTLNTVAFQGNPFTSYLWDNASTGATRIVDTPGRYAVTVTYGGGCVVKDTILLTKIANPTLAISSVIAGPDYQLTLMPSGLVGSPLYTLDSVKPAGTVTTPLVQTSSLFIVPLAVTEASFHVTDQTSGCMAARMISGVPLPVVLFNFSGRRKSADNVLYWTVDWAADVREFILEYSADGSHFKAVAAVMPSNGADGQYSFVHKEIFNDAYYRLSIVNSHGSREYSHIIRMPGMMQTSLCQDVYPIPFSDALHISFASGNASTISISLSDMQGSVVKSLSVSLPAGTTDLLLDNLAAMPAGIYLLRLVSDHGQELRGLVKR